LLNHAVILSLESKSNTAELEYLAIP
jgi:hypothetical protein